MSNPDTQFEIDVLELQWRLSNVNPNVPRPFPDLPIDCRPESLLAQHATQAECERDDWRAIAESYRELAQICLEAAAKHWTEHKRLAKENKELRELL